MSDVVRRLAHAARRPIRAAVLAVGLALALAACGPAGTQAPPPGSAPVATPIASPSLNPPTANAQSTASTQPTSPVAIDPSLLAVLPATVDGIEVKESPEAEIAAMAGPELVAVGSAMAAGIAIDATTGQFVYAVVVRLKPGVMNDSVFRDWRDSYDEGACSQANGVAGHAETDIGGRTVYIGTCNGGARTYHVWLGEQGMLISASAVGDRRLGEQLMENLRP